MSDQLNSLEPNPIGEEISDDPILGKVIKNYPGDRLRLLIIGGVIYGAAAMILNIAFLPVDASTASVFVIGGIALLSLVIGWYILHYWNREVVLYENGFSYQLGSNTYFYKFSEIIATHYQAERYTYFGGLVRRTVKRFTLTTDQDEVIVLDQLYKHLDELVTRFEREIHALLREKIHDQLSSGYDVPFGSALKISSGGLTLNNKPLSWSDFAGYAISDGRLILHSQAQTAWDSVPLTGVQNAPLLIEQLKAHKRG